MMYKGLALPVLDLTQVLSLIHSIDQLIGVTGRKENLFYTKK